MSQASDLALLVGYVAKEDFTFNIKAMKALASYYAFHRPRNHVFANNSLMECLIAMKFLHPDVIFSSHTMFINASTKEFTLVNNAISSYDIAF